MGLLSSIKLLAAALILSSCAVRQPVAPAQSSVPARSTAFIVAANPLAAEAGAAILRQGGSAVDAAVALQAMLSLVEPQSSGLGGGAFLTFYEGTTRRITI